MLASQVCERVWVAFLLRLTELAAPVAMTCLQCNMQLGAM